MRSPRDATVAVPAGPIDVEILRTGPLVVRDTTDRARYEREVHTFTPGVEDGTSGAPLVDDDGRVLGIVVLDNPAAGVAYAVTGEELSRSPRGPATNYCPPTAGPAKGRIHATFVHPVPDPARRHHPGRRRLQR